MKFKSKFKTFHSWKCIWKCWSMKWQPFCPGGVNYSLQNLLARWATWPSGTLGPNILLPPGTSFLPENWIFIALILVKSLEPLKISSTGDQGSVSILTHWPLGDLDVILKLQFSILFFDWYLHIVYSKDNALRWMPRDLTDDKSTLV